MTLKKRILVASSYKDTNFFEAENIGVIARGPSSGAVKFCYDKFKHCFLAGEFNNYFEKIGLYLKDKDIVLSILYNFRYRTSAENCKKYNIKNVQVQYQYKTDDYLKCIEFYKDLNVVGYGRRHYDLIYNIIGENRGIPSTGMGAILNALYFNPKRIYICGIDFYDNSTNNKGVYFVKEDHDTNAMVEDTGAALGRKNFRLNMIKAINKIARIYDTKIIMYTTFRGIVSKKNLEVIYV